MGVAALEGSSNFDVNCILDASSSEAYFTNRLVPGTLFRGALFDDSLSARPSPPEGRRKTLSTTRSFSFVVGQYFTAATRALSISSHLRGPYFQQSLWVLEHYPRKTQPEDSSRFHFYYFKMNHTAQDADAAEKLTTESQPSEGAP